MCRSNTEFGSSIYELTFPDCNLKYIGQTEDHFQFDIAKIFLSLNKIMAIQNMQNTSKNLAPYKKVSRIIFTCGKNEN